MRFVKMHGLGNDYVYLDGFNETLPSDLSALAVEMADRHCGVGGDGLIAILPTAEADCQMRMYNMDGSEGEMCGNGVRCVAKLMVARGHAKGPDVTVATRAGLIRTRIVSAAHPTMVRVDMGRPRLLDATLPQAGPTGFVEQPLLVDGQQLVGTAVSMGNPHFVTFVADVESVDVAGIGRRVEHHPSFPERTNVEFIEVLEGGDLKMRVWERGSGITEACGTGACAAAVAAVLTRRGFRHTTVHLPGGDLHIEWDADDHVYMTGPAVEVFEGDYHLS